MHKAKLLVRGQKVSLEQQKVVQASVMWNVPCTSIGKWIYRDGFVGIQNAPTVGLCLQNIQAQRELVETSRNDADIR